MSETYAVAATAAVVVVAVEAVVVADSVAFAAADVVDDAAVVVGCDGVAELGHDENGAVVPVGDAFASVVVVVETMTFLGHPRYLTYHPVDSNCSF